MDPLPRERCNWFGWRSKAAHWEAAEVAEVAGAVEAEGAEEAERAEECLKRDRRH